MFRSPLTLIDIPWLRLAARQTGVCAVPMDIAAKLLARGLVERHTTNDCFTITARGKLALSRLC
jgi:hypothetical protein